MPIIKAEKWQERQVDVDGYSLWGGSAGARMAAWLGSYGPAAFGEDDLPRPGAVIMHYPGLPHGFGLGTGTAAEGWIDQAIAFWEAVS